MTKDQVLASWGSQKSDSFLFASTYRGGDLRGDSGVVLEQRDIRDSFRAIDMCYGDSGHYRRLEGFGSKGRAEASKSFR